MKNYPYILRLEQLVRDLPDFADEVRAAHDDGDFAVPEEARVHLARAAILTIGGSQLDHHQLSDPVTGVAVTQKGLQDLINQGYRTAYSAEAFALHALDVCFQQGRISEEDGPKYTSGELDPTEHIRQVLDEFAFTSVTAANGEPYYLSPHF